MKPQSGIISWKNWPDHPVQFFFQCCAVSHLPKKFKYPKNEDDLKKEDNIKNDDDLKNKDDLKNRPSPNIFVWHHN